MTNNFSDVLSPPPAPSLCMYQDKKSCIMYLIKAPQFNLVALSAVGSESQFYLQAKGVRFSNHHSRSQVTDVSLPNILESHCQTNQTSLRYMYQRLDFVYAILYFNGCSSPPSAEILVNALVICHVNYCNLQSCFPLSHLVLSHRFKVSHQSLLPKIWSYSLIRVQLPS